MRPEIPPASIARIAASIGYFWDAGYEIYPALRGLLAEGLVTAKTERGQGRPDKKIYALTEEGRLELKRWLESPTVKEYVRYEALS